MTYKFELTKPQIARHDELKQLLADARETLKAAEEKANEESAVIINDLNLKIDGFNKLLMQAASFADEVQQEALRQIERKSTRWQESDVGEAACDWQSTWENIDLTPITPIDEITVDSIGYEMVEEFSGLPQSA